MYIYRYIKRQKNVPDLKQKNECSHDERNQILKYYITEFTESNSD